MISHDITSEKGMVKRHVSDPHGGLKVDVVNIWTDDESF